MPHPPESISGIGTPEQLKAAEKTLKAFERLRHELEKSDPDTVVIISPHAQLEPYSFVINSSDILKGTLAQFGLDDVRTYENNLVFANKLAFAGLMNDIPTVLRENFLDHGALIPLEHLLKNIRPKVVHLAFSLMDYDQQYSYGEVIKSIISSGVGGRVAIVASAGLSHKLTSGSPMEYSPKAQKFDMDILHYLGSNDLASILDLQPEAVKEAAECGVRSIVMLLGALHGTNYKFNLLSYEYPTGIGYLTARLV